MHKIKRRDLKHQDGFLTLEAAVAVMILGVFATSGAMILVQVQRENRILRQHQVVRQELANLAEAALLMESDELLGQPQEAFQISSHLQEYCKNSRLSTTSSIQPDDPAMVRITFTIAWNPSASRQEMRQALTCWKSIAKDDQP